MNTKNHRIYSVTMGIMDTQTVDYDIIHQVSRVNDVTAAIAIARLAGV